MNDVPVADLRRRAEQGPRPDPDALFRHAAERAAGARRRRRLVTVLAVAVVAVVAVSVAAVRRTDSTSISTVDPAPTSTRPPSTPATTPTTTPTTTISTDTGPLLQTGGIMVDDGTDLVVIDPETGVRTRVAAGLLGSWSPDRRDIAVHTPSVTVDDGLSVMALDSAHRQQVYFGAGAPDHPAWSPDGRRLAFGVPANNPDTIMVVNRDGTGLRTVGSGRYAVWSPDGTQLYANTLSELVQIQRMNVDGSGVQLVTRGPGQQGQPAVSRTALAFVDNTTHGISVSNLDGSDVRSITGCAVPACPSDFSPVWSPDGTRLAFLRATGASDVVALVIVSAETHAELAHFDAANPGQLFVSSWR